MSPPIYSPQNEQKFIMSIIQRNECRKAIIPRFCATFQILVTPCETKKDAEAERVMTAKILGNSYKEVNGSQIWMFSLL